MSQISVYGASDDLLEVEGDITDEFNPSWRRYDDDKEPSYLIVSDGSVLAIRYDENGIWRITRIISGTATMEKKDGDIVKDTNDIVTLTGDIKWVMFTDRAVFAK
jgi:hypothetical protein